MLSAFAAEPIVELKQRDKSKIESILLHGDNLLVGVTTGSLRVYRTNTATEGQSEVSLSKPAELLREYEKFSKSRIEQFAIFREANILISLSGGLVSIHELGTYTLQDTLTKTKGATLFAATSNIVQDSTTNVNTIVSRLAVAVRRKVVLWSWHDGELLGDAREFAFSNSIKSLTWSTATKIVVGLNSNYFMLDVETQEQKIIVGPGSIGGQPGQDHGSGALSYLGMSGMAPVPLATGLGVNEMLLAKDVNTHFIDRSGDAIGRKQVPWRSVPKAVGYSYPYLLSLQEKGALEVRNPHTLTLLQAIDLHDASLLQVPNPNISLAHQGKGFLVASDRVVWRMKGLPYDVQLDALVQAGQLDEAISLLDLIEDTLIQDKTERLRTIKMEKAQKLFDASRYRDSLDLFAAVSAPPEKVIGLYPELIAGDRAHERPSSPLQPKTSGSIKSKHSIEKLRFPGHNEKELKEAVRELQAFLADIRRRLSRFFSSEQTVKTLSELRDGPQAEDNKIVMKYILEIEDDNDEEQVRDRVLKIAMLVDTTLFRVYMFANPSLAGSLFRIANHCDPEVVMSKLEENGRYSELIDFLYGKKLHRAALETLRKFGQAERTEAIDPQLHSPERTITYLQNLSAESIDLILEFAKWPMEVKPDAAMEIFVADTENADALPRERVLHFLESIDKKFAIHYLEHLIDELQDATPELHQKLIDLYMQAMEDGEKQARGSSLLPKLITHLRQSSQYSYSRALALLPKEDPDFFEAQAIVLSKMNQHRQALHIYVFKLNDTVKAEEYCNEVYLQQSSSQNRKKNGVQTEDATSETNTIYTTLLGLYLTPPDGAQARVHDAVSLLTNHAPRLPASATLDLIPTDLLIKELEQYLRGRVRHTTTALYDTRIVSNLRKVEAVRVQARLLLGEEDDIKNGIQSFESGLNEARMQGKRRNVRVDDERVCRVCHKRLGLSVISMFNDSSVVHLGCQARRELELKPNVSSTRS